MSIRSHQSRDVALGVLVSLLLLSHASGERFWGPDLRVPGAGTTNGCADGQYCCVAVVKLSVNKPCTSISGWSDFDKENGGCVDFDSNVKNCGYCGLSCYVPYSTGVTCRHGKCVASECRVGASHRFLFFHRVEIGVITKLVQSLSAPCVLAGCQPGWALCLDRCRSPINDPTLCGPCGIKCQSDKVCISDGTGEGSYCYKEPPPPPPAGATQSMGACNNDVECSSGQCEFPAEQLLTGNDVRSTISSLCVLTFGSVGIDNPLLDPNDSWWNIAQPARVCL
ncbi:hypothetical protein M427DRAFT_385220 [Gonapodya prolifera JEL478]|uniref:4Fe-4S ferredoxin-type domain-containing protein n=1 Tax=Gonapodya prolifera (strain JEL478) TaxID=1344416 RepID=A0A139A8N6_GONPJ|nr:hypothetical protein M427DRAFT_385220 [Gonapodya prolifera JEL478]|eukprot:KXS13074.1 hypothetical protein M427DRAFT_385220 [Gonapodya prolifera JEL478]